jgi:sugar/nucleoside kinase (ribokinase family)
MHTGGSAVNTAIALAGMGMDVGFIGRVGQDSLAEQALADLKAAGVNCDQVQLDSKVNTGVTFIAVTVDGERTMFAARGANSFTQAKDIDHAYFDHCRWIHLSSYSFLAHHQYETILTVLDLAENLPYTRISLDIGTEPAVRARLQILKLLPRLDLILPNEVEISLLGNGLPIEQCLGELHHKHSADAIVTKQGHKGCLFSVENRQVNIPAFDIDVKDTTGAGDSFNAGVVLGRLVGLSWDASSALGNAMGGLACGQPGAGAFASNRNVVSKLIETHLFKEKWTRTRNALEELMVWFEGVL